MNICSDILNNVDTDPGLLNTVTLKETSSESVEVVKAKATEVLNQLTEADFQHFFQQKKSRMERCRDRQGDYIEGEKVATISLGISVIPKSVTKSRIIENIDVFDFNLDPDELAYLDSCNKNQRVLPFKEFEKHKHYSFHSEF
ncbi:hypothetical protein NQ318_007156 [Aromia moschata]|uniref:Uncharacterized protein n=1 Tax=Aromia moschata TaxID=1265417 RepID=A0AAV8XPF6_9CUCU|nr:hypothetical protein NQ318_007156 [Aromia moschata]